MPEAKTVLEMVTEFNQTFDQLINAEPTIPSNEIVVFRNNFIKEELQEFLKAVLENNIVDVADAICDLQYVLTGLVLNCGLQDKFPALMAEVHASNMSKSCQTIEEAGATIEAVKEENGDCYYKQTSNGKYIVCRKSDNKIMKPLTYFKPDLAKILKA